MNLVGGFPILELGTTAFRLILPIKRRYEMTVIQDALIEGGREQASTAWLINTGPLESPHWPMPNDSKMEKHAKPRKGKGSASSADLPEMGWQRFMMAEMATSKSLGPQWQMMASMVCESDRWCQALEEQLCDASVAWTLEWPVSFLPIPCAASHSYIQLQLYHVLTSYNISHIQVISNDRIWCYI